MKLYHSPLSPYVRKVMVTAHETGLIDRIEVIDGATTPLDPNPQLVKDNPLGRIPALVADDGAVLFDSRVICRYLNHVAGGSLYGSDDFAILTREAMAEGMIDSALLCAYEARFRPEDKRVPEFTDGMRAKIRRAADAFNARIDEMQGDLTIDKIALCAALGYVDFRLSDLGWRDGNPALAEWYEKISQRPSMKATAPA